MNILILGSHGMIGGGLMKHFNELGYNVNGLVRSQFAVDLNDSSESIQKNLSAIPEYMESDIIVNCIGIIKQRIQEKSDEYINFVNAEFPILLSAICKSDKKSFVQISTDCVFSGDLGFYDEVDSPDARDLYGQSKAASEVVCDTSLVIRTSTIGVESNTSHGLLSWYLNQKENVNGFVNALYSGVSLRELSVSIAKLLELRVLRGLYNVSSEPISKHDLLWLLYMLGVGPKVIPDFEIIIDRSLNDAKFRNVTGLTKPNWIDMAVDIKKEIAEKN